MNADRPCRVFTRPSSATLNPPVPVVAPKVHVEGPKQAIWAICKSR